KAAERKPRGHFGYAGHARQLRGELCGAFDPMLFGRAGTGAEERRGRNLEVPRLRMDDRFGELPVQICDEAGADDQGRDAERDHGKGHRAARAMAKDVAEGEFDQQGDASRYRLWRSASTTFVRDAFHAG